MDEAETKTCQNCKREIPVVNFTIHSVHCARNIRVCPVCKEPIPLAELEAHHEKLHKLLPCKQCGEMVCGTDMEDHIRDSCAHTNKTCRFCELEVSRRELPHHEGYCGARTEQCSECSEWVMLKYRQLHLDSNHGFLRLDDDPAPTPRPVATTFTNFPKLGDWPKLANPGGGFNRPHHSGRAGNEGANGYLKNVNLAGPREVRQTNFSLNFSSAATPAAGTSGDFSRVLRTIDNVNVRPMTLDNIQATLDAAVENIRNISVSRGAVKKRPAPRPPSSAPAAGPSKPVVGSPLSPESPNSPTSPTSPTSPRVATPSTKANSSNASSPDVSPMDRRKENLPAVVPSSSAVPSRPQNQDKLRQKESPRLPGAAQRKYQDRPTENARPTLQAPKNQREPEVKRRDDLKNLKPMSPEQFMNRFKELQLRKEPVPSDRSQDRAEPDRFSEIKSSLKQLRRGLNEVTAPYNMNAGSNNNINVDNWRRPELASPREEEESGSEEEGARGEGGAGGEGGLEDVRLPCEFCATLVPAADLVLHQTGCRPDLARLAPERRRSPPPDNAPQEPVIPCEFCTEPLPIYLISEHQERCGREANLLFPD